MLKSATLAEIIEVARKHNVNITGYRYFDPRDSIDVHMRSSENFDKDEKGRSEESEWRVELCREWIRTVAIRRKTFNRYDSTYGMKHFVSDYFRSGLTNTYVTNGHFIIACYLENVDIRQESPTSPNGEVKLSLPKVRGCGIGNARLVVVNI